MKSVIQIIIILIFSKCYAIGITDQEVFEATFEACSSINYNDVVSLQGDNNRAGKFPSSKFNNILKDIRNESLNSGYFELAQQESPAIALINNRMFKLALAECYSDNIFMINYFKKAVLRAERSGKLVNLSFWLVAFKGYIGGVGLVGKYVSKLKNINLLLDKWILSALGISMLRSDSKNQNLDSAKIDKTQLIEVINSESNYANEILESIHEEINLEKMYLDKCQRCIEKNKSSRNIEILMELKQKIQLLNAE